MRGQAPSRKQPARGADIEHALSVTFEEAMQGLVIDIEVERSEACAACHGKGEMAETNVTCPTCNGSGQQQRIIGGATRCAHCNGSGKVARPCSSCHGTGIVPQRETVAARIKA